MKVIQILPELNAGGVERGTLEVGKYLTDQGHESIVISNGGRLVEQLETEGSRHITLPVHQKRLSSLKQVKVLRKLFEDEKPDILHLRSRLPAWLAYLAWRKMDPTTRPRLVTTVHGFNSVNRYSKIMTCGERVICDSRAVVMYTIVSTVRNCTKSSLFIVVSIPANIIQNSSRLANGREIGMRNIPKRRRRSFSLCRVVSLD